MTQLAKAAAVVAATTLALNTQAEQPKDPYAGMRLTPAPQPEHVETVAARPAPAFYLAQATPTPIQPAPIQPATVIKIPDGSLSPQQETEFAKMLARIHNAHIDNYVQTARSADFKEIDAAYTIGAAKGSASLNKYHHYTNPEKIKKAEAGELAAAKAKEETFKAEFDGVKAKGGTKLQQFELLQKYLVALDGETAALDVANQKWVANAPRFMNAKDATDFAVDVVAREKALREVFTEVPKPAKGPKR